jgi:hypothetical protein
MYRKEHPVAVHTTKFVPHPHTHTVCIPSLPHENLVHAHTHANNHTYTHTQSLVRKKLNSSHAHQSCPSKLATRKFSLHTYTRKQSHTQTDEQLYTHSLQKILACTHTHANNHTHTHTHEQPYTHSLQKI